VLPFSLYYWLTSYHTFTNTLCFECFVCLSVSRLRQYTDLPSGNNKLYFRLLCLEWRTAPELYLKKLTKKSKAFLFCPPPFFSKLNLNNLIILIFLLSLLFQSQSGFMSSSVVTSNHYYSTRLRLVIFLRQDVPVLSRIVIFTDISFIQI